MLTIDFDLLGMRPGELVLDVGCGGGRHTFEALRRGARVVAVDLDRGSLRELGGTVVAMGDECWCLCGDALRLPFGDETFDAVIASELLEHIDADEVAMRELSRVLKPGAHAAVTVPRWWPERVCWALSSEYHSNRGGHVRIYGGRALRHRLRRNGLMPLRSHHAHALHSPYWWLKCAFGTHSVVDLYHRFLVWDIESGSRLVRTVERVLDPVLGKSLVLYLRKHGETRLRARRLASRRISRKSPESSARR